MTSLTIKYKHNGSDLYAKYVFDLVSSFQRLESLTFWYDWQRNEAVDAIIYFLTNCKQIQNFTCTRLGRTPVGQRANVQQTFIDTFKKSEKLNATHWEIKFENGSKVFITKRKAVPKGLCSV